MKIIQFNEKLIYGLSARTNNHNEKNPNTGKIGPLVKKFDELAKVNYRAGARVYSVYFNYASDLNGDYSVLVGADAVESSEVPLEKINISAGNYLVFAGSGQVPQVVFETWAKIWHHFSEPNCPHVRAYTVDFEFYKSQSDIEIYIAVK